jgi:hypothetical protein
MKETRLPGQAWRAFGCNLRVGGDQRWCNADFKVDGAWLANGRWLLWMGFGEL